MHIVFSCAAGTLHSRKATSCFMHRQVRFISTNKKDQVFFVGSLDTGYTN